MMDISKCLLLIINASIKNIFILYFLKNEGIPLQFSAFSQSIIKNAVIRLYTTLNRHLTFVNFPFANYFTLIACWIVVFWRCERNSKLGFRISIIHMLSVIITC